MAFPRILLQRLLPRAAALLAFAGVLGAAQPGAAQPGAGPAELMRPRQTLEAARMESTPEGVLVEFAPPAPGDAAGRLVLAVPSKITTAPLVQDYRLRRLPGSPAGADAVTSDVLTAADEETLRTFAAVPAWDRILRLESAGWARFHHLATLESEAGVVEIPGQGRWRLESATVLIGRGDGVSSAGRETPPNLEGDAMTALLRGVVANPDGLERYASRTAPPAHTLPLRVDRWSPLLEAPEAAWLRLDVEEDGPYRVQAAHLAAAGLDPAQLTPAGLALFSRGEAVPVLPVDDGRPGFGPNDALLFYGLGSRSEYARERAYWLMAGPGAAAKAVAMPAEAFPRPPETLRPLLQAPYEAEFGPDRTLLILSGNFLSITGTEWVWREIGAEPETLEFALPFRDPREDAPLPLRMRFVQETRPRLRVDEREDGRKQITFSDRVRSGAGEPPAPTLRLRINDGQERRFVLFKGEDGELIEETEIPVDDLRPGTNTLTLRLSRDAENASDYGLFLDKFTVEYPRGFFAEDGRVDLRTREAGDWYSIAGFETPPAALDVTDPEAPALAALRPLQSRPGAPPMHLLHEAKAGRRVVIVAPGAVPAAPFGGVAQATALADASNEADYLLIFHASLREAAETLAEARRGDGLRVRMVEVGTILQEFGFGETTPHAIKDFLLHALRTWRVPPSTVCLLGDASSDYRDALRSGVANLLPAYTWEAESGDDWASELWYADLLGADLLPDVVLGRISARNLPDAREMVAKQIAYDRAPPAGPWRARVGYCSDDGAFRAATEEMRTEYRPPAFASERIYLGDLPYEKNFYISDEIVERENWKVSTAATLELLRTFNRGVAMMLYFGHGSPNIWTDERIWFGGDSPNSDNRNLRNDGRLPFVATFTCNQGAFDYPMPKWHVNISEDMMRVPHGGAVALFVPSGPGQTNEHLRVARPLMRNFFRDGVRRVGDLAARTQIDYVLDNGPREMIRMYVLLGDPAVRLAAPTRTAEGVVSPSAVDQATLGAGAEIEFRAPAGVERGRCLVRLTGPEDDPILSEGPLAFDGGEIVWRTELPRDLPLGAYRVRAWWTGEGAARDDGVVWAPLQVSRPVLAIERTSFQRRPAAGGERALISATVSNASPVAAEGAELIVETWALGSDEPFDVRRTPLRLAAEGVESFVVDCPSTAPLSVYRARLSTFTLPLDDEKSPAAAPSPLFAFTPEGAAVPPLVSHPLLASAEWRSAAPRLNCTIRVPLHYVAPESDRRLTASLEDARGETLIDRPLRIKAGPNDRGTVEFEGRVLRDASETSLPLRLVVRPEDGPSTEPVLRLPLDTLQPLLPNLRIVPGSVRFIPQTPVDGTTVFAELTVENAGAVAARSFTMRAAEVREGRALRDLHPAEDIGRRGERPLGAGQRRAVRMRWDYHARERNAGTTRIRFEADPTNAIHETDESDNAVEAALRILSEADPAVLEVRTEYLDLPEGGRLGRVDVEVGNRGEAPARGRRLGLFRHEPADLSDYQNPDVVLTEIALPEIPGETIMPVRHEWRLDAGEAETTVTAKVYQTLQSIRAGMARETVEAPEWP